MFHYYAFRVDGALVFDPGSHAFYGAARHGSGIEVPEPGVDFHHLKDVPHGYVRFRSYFSAITGQWRRCLVYTPPDYDTDLEKRCSLLYLQHGSYEDETGWFFQGRANLILDNLIAEGKALPMLIVLDNCYAAYPKNPNAVGDGGPAGGAEGFFLNGRHVVLKGTNNHQDHAGVGAAVPDT